MDSTLAVQQYIQQVIRRDPSNIDMILKMPDAQDEGVWKYEHLRLVMASLLKQLLLKRSNYWLSHLNYLFSCLIN